MPKSARFLLLLFFGLATAVQAQKKIKYKDLFPLLDVRNYSEAIPQLRTFLNDPKNADEANAQLQMGLYYETLVNEYNLIKDSTSILSETDSVLKYLNRAKSLITEKELKKNDDYYQGFYRRDLRTGEFGIKISDVQLDLEKKIQSFESIKQYGREIYGELFAANKANTFSFQAYKTFVEKFENETNLKLMATDEELEILVKMSDNEADLKEAFDDIRSAVSRISKKGYSPELDLQELNVFGEDGMSEVDVFTNDVAAWEYGEWAYRVKKEIEEDIAGMKTQLLEVDQKLKKDGERLKGLEIFPFEELTHGVDSKLTKQLNVLDKNALPLKLFSLQIKKNEFDFIVKSDLNPRLADEDDVDYQLMITDSLVSVLDEIQEDVDILQDEYIEDGKKKYSKLVNDVYGGDFGLIKLRQRYEEFLNSARSKWSDKNDFYTNRSKWGVSDTSEDSIYLVPDSNYVVNNRAKFFTAAVIKDDSSNTFVIGLDRSGTKEKGFMAMISNARSIVWKANFSLDKFAYGGDSTELIAAKFIPSQEDKISAYLYSPTLDADVNLIVANAQKVGQIDWANQLSVKKEPISVKFNDLVKETIVYMMTEEEMETMTLDDIGYYVIDRSGSVR